jgi:hypothetical protein
MLRIVCFGRVWEYHCWDRHVRAEEVLRLSLLDALG